MSTPASRAPRPGSPRTAAAGLAVFALVALLGVTWAKWWPYSHKVGDLVATREWPGTSPLEVGADAGVWSGAWAFTWAYSAAVWKALVVALVVAAAVEALLPKAWVTSVLTRRGRYGSSLAGGLLSMPTMMCTCCTAPVAASLRRHGAPVSATLAYWVGNPTLNPAVLVFLALVAPWQWAFARLAVGVVLVVVLTAAVARFVEGRSPALPRLPEAESAGPSAGLSAGTAVRRFGRALGRMSVTLVPEYLLVVLAVGALSGWIASTDVLALELGLGAVLVAAVLGTLLVVPTGGEIPVVLALAAAGVGGGTLGVLMVTLPAVSLPSMVMVARTLSWPVTVATAGAVMLAGLLAGGLLVVLS